MYCLPVQPIYVCLPIVLKRDNLSNSTTEISQNSSVKMGSTILLLFQLYSMKKCYKKVSFFKIFLSFIRYCSIFLNVMANYFYKLHYIVCRIKRSQVVYRRTNEIFFKRTERLEVQSILFLS